jgi:hypothetical protein
MSISGVPAPVPLLCSAALSRQSILDCSGHEHAPRLPVSEKQLWYGAGSPYAVCGLRDGDQMHVVGHPTVGADLDGTGSPPQQGDVLLGVLAAAHRRLPPIPPGVTGRGSPGATARALRTMAEVYSSLYPTSRIEYGVPGVRLLPQRTDNLSPWNAINAGGRCQAVGLGIGAVLLPRPALRTDLGSGSCGAWCGRPPSGVPCEAPTWRGAP